MTLYTRELKKIRKAIEILQSVEIMGVTVSQMYNAKRALYRMESDLIANGAK